MRVSSQESSLARSFGHKLYLALISVILLGIVSEGVLIGPSLFAATHFGRAIHGDLGGVLFLLTLLLPVVSGLSRMPGRMTLLSTVQAVLALLEVTSAALGRRVPLLAALHPANALLLMALTVLLLVQARRLMRQGSDVMEPK